MEIFAEDGYKTETCPERNPLLVLFYVWVESRYKLCIVFHKFQNCCNIEIMSKIPKINVDIVRTAQQSQNLVNEMYLA